jgi:hypothetical protein
MATHGKAREATINALRDMEDFKRAGFAMQGLRGCVASTGKMPADDAIVYKAHAHDGNVLYTVLSYTTPIAYVTVDGAVRIPDAKYSVTTTHHQNLCKVYLNR